MRAIKSPRMRAHPLKRSNKKMKKMLSKSYNDDYLESGSIKSISSSYSTGSRYEPQASIELSREVLDDIGLLKIQLSETIEENSMMKSRLHMELKERHSLEMKNKDLTEKLLDARKGLQETGAALYKVQQATDQLMRKRDQREVQLQRALDANSVYEAKIAELETKLAKTEDGSKVQATIASYRKIINEKDDIIRILEEQQFTSQNQLAKIKRENQRLIEEKMDYDFSLETKQKKINLLEANFRFLEDKLSGPDFAGMSKQSLFEKLMQEPFNASIAGKGKTDEKKDDKKEEKESNGNTNKDKDSKEKGNGDSNNGSGGGRSDADFKMMENRLAQLESQLSRQNNGPRTPNNSNRPPQMQQQQQSMKMGGENDSLFFSGSVVEAAVNPNAFGGSGSGRPDSNQGARYNNGMQRMTPPGQGMRPNSNQQMRQGGGGGPNGPYGPPGQQQQMNSPRQYQQGGPPPGYQQQQGPPPGYQQRGPPPGYQQGPPPQQQYQQGPPPQQQQQQRGPPPGYQQGPPPQQQGPPQQQYQQGPPPQQQQAPPPQQQYQPPPQQQQAPPQQQYQAPPVQQQAPPPVQQPQYQPPPQQQAPPVQQYQPPPQQYQVPPVQQPVYQAPPMQQAPPVQQYQAPAPVAVAPAPTTAVINGAPVTVALNAVDPAQQYSAEARKTPASKPGSRASIIDSLLQTTAQNKPVTPAPTSAPAPAVAAPAPVVAAPAPAPAAAAPSVKASRGTIVGGPPASAKAATPSTPANQSSVTESLEEGTGNPEWDALQREKKELKKAIYVWTKDFVTQHQREPTKEEREGDAKDMFKRYRTNSKLIKEMEDSGRAGAAGMSMKMSGMSIKE